MKFSDKGLDQLKVWEGSVIVGGRHVPYDDTTGKALKKSAKPKGVVTIGYGHAIFKAEDVPWTGWTERQATEELAEDLAWATAAVSGGVSVELNQNQYDALVIWTFNVGKTNMRTSTLIKKLNAGNYKAAAKEFGRWKYARQADGTRVAVKGLVARRTATKRLFESIYTEGPAMKRADIDSSRTIRVATVTQALGGVSAVGAAASQTLGEVSPILDFVKANSLWMVVGLGAAVAVAAFIIVKLRMGDHEAVK